MRRLGIILSLDELAIGSASVSPTCHCFRTSIDEMLSAFQSLADSGKMRYFGVTDMPVWQFAKFRYAAVPRGGLARVSTQHHYNLVWREHESELVPMCEAEGIGLLPYSPFARGFLTGAAAGHDRDTERGRTDEYARRWYGRPSDEAVRQALVMDEIPEKIRIDAMRNSDRPGDSYRIFVKRSALPGAGPVSPG
ncbi:MAG TPA: aldo/keto reductase [Pseudonocardiaceae bacterium]